MTQRFISETAWFPGHIKPVYVGNYQRQPKGKDYLLVSWWTGMKWAWADDQYPEIHNLDQDLPWRGLSSPVGE